MDMAEDSDENGCEGSVAFGEEDNIACENQCHLVLQDTSLNQERYSNNGEYQVLTRVVLKYGRVLQEDENEIFEQLITFIYKKEKEKLVIMWDSKAMVKCAENKINNCVLKKIDTLNLTELNNTMCDGAACF